MQLTWAVTLPGTLQEKVKIHAWVIIHQGVSQVLFRGVDYQDGASYFVSMVQFLCPTAVFPY